MIILTEEFIANVIANISVPAALCFYCLFTLNKSVNKLSDKVDHFADRVNQLLDAVKNLERELRPTNRS